MKDFERPVDYSTANLSAQMQSLHKDFEAWKRDHDRLESRYVYVLQNNYSQEQLSLNVLSEGDLSLARALRGVGQRLGFDIFLARMENRRTGHVLVDEYDYEDDSCELGDFHEMEEVLEESVSLESVFDMSGRLLVADASVDKEEILQQNWEDNDEASETDLENTYSDATATHVFRGTVSILVSDSQGRRTNGYLGTCNHVLCGGQSIPCS